MFEGAGEDGRKHDMFEAHASMYLTDERAKLVFFVRHAEGNPMCIEGKECLESPAMVTSAVHQREREREREMSIYTYVYICIYI